MRGSLKMHRRGVRGDPSSLIARRRIVQNIGSRPPTKNLRTKATQSRSTRTTNGLTPHMVIQAHESRTILGESELCLYTNVS